MWSGLGAIVAVGVLAALFVSVFGQLNVHRIDQARATATPLGPLATVAPASAVTGPALTWETRSFPASVVPPPGNQLYDNGFAFSPTDPNTAYICATTNDINAPNTIWATHDGAKTWTHVSDIPYKSEVAQCTVTVDAANPLHVNVVFSEDEGIRSLVSDDGGKTWHVVPDDIILEDLITRGSHSFAVAYPLDNPSGRTVNPIWVQTGRPARLVVSHDDWRTWQPIDGSIFSQNLRISQVWMRPSDGALLALATPYVAPPIVGPGTPEGAAEATWFANYVAPQDTLWASSDQGAHWGQVPTPPNLRTFLVAQPVGGEPWKICGFGAAFGCTFDGGKTWLARPTLAQNAACGQTCGLNDALLSDGSVVVRSATGIPNSSDILLHVLRLTQDSNQWQDLGATPSGNASIIIGGPSAALVTYSGGADGDNSVGGVIVGHLGGPISHPGDLSFAPLS
jgi:hypothetical protein